MKIDDTLLSHLEKLSMLTIADEKRKAVEGQLTEILGFVENLSELDTDNVEATFTTIESGQRLREDAPAHDAAITKATLENAPMGDGSFFVVPKIIE